MSTRTRVRPHPFRLDESLADRHESARRAQLGLSPRTWCGTCGLPGRPGDSRHTALTLEEAARQWREFDAARIGEKVDA